MKVFDLLFHEFRDKSGDTIDFVFVQKDSVGVQKKRVYKTNNSTNFDVKESLDFLNNIQEQFDWMAFSKRCQNRG